MYSHSDPLEYGTKAKKTDAVIQRGKLPIEAGSWERGAREGNSEFSHIKKKPVLTRVSTPCGYGRGWWGSISLINTCE